MLRSAVVAAALVLATGPAWSHGDSHGGTPAAKSGPVNTEEHAFGRAGDPRQAARTIHIGMDDTMHFRAHPRGASPTKPGDLVLKRG
jgi:hypothetical protein